MSRLLFWIARSAALTSLFISPFLLAAQNHDWLTDPIGMNLAGADAPKRPGITGEAYIAPVGQELRYYRSKHIRLFRISFYWESIQRQLNGPLDQEELRRLDAIVEEARRLKVKVILDVHSYDRRAGKVLGSDPALETAFADLWLRLAKHFDSQDGIFGYGIMNEPHDTNNTWPHTAQLAINAIRTVDQRHRIILPGDHWSSTAAWVEANPDILEVNDPAQKLIYEGHVYFDADGSGVYKHTYDVDHVYPDIGVERVKPFVEWLARNNADGIVTELGIPGNDPRWNDVLDHTLKYLHKNRISAVYWAGGPLWHHYPLSAEPTKLGDAPQMSVLARFARRRSWWHIF